MSLICEKEFSIHVGSSIPIPRLWWKSDEPTLNQDHFDAILGVDYIPQAFGGGANPYTPAGLFGNALGLRGGPPDAYISMGNSGIVPAEMNYNITGISHAFWLKFNAASTVNTLFLWNYDSGTIAFTISWQNDLLTFSQSPDAYSDSAPFAPVIGDWNLFVITYDPADQKTRLFINNALAFESPSGANVIPVSGAGYYNLETYGANPATATYDISMDEFSTYDYPLSGGEVGYLWNGGVGRTWPF